MLFVTAPAVIQGYFTWIGVSCMQDGLTLVLSKARPMAATLRQKVVSGVRIVRAVGMRLALAASLSLPVFAGETTGGGSGSNDLSTVVAATDTVTTVVSKAWDLILSNALTRTYVAAGLLSTGIGMLVYLRRSSKR